MKTLVLTLVGLLYLGQAFASGGAEIILDRNATFEDRKSVQEILAKAGKEKPLELEAAVVELCYQVDLCAGLTTDSDFASICGSGSEANAAKDGLNQCYPKYFRKEYTCNPKIQKQTWSSTKVAGHMISDFSQLYRSYTQDLMITSFSKMYNADFQAMIEDGTLEDYLKANPAAKERTQASMLEGFSLGSYTLDCYNRMNQILYSKNNTYELNRYYNLFRAVIDTMGLFPEYKGMVNRGVHLPKDVLKEHHKVGNVVCYNGFVSTSIHNAKRDRTNNPENVFLSGKCTQRLYIRYDERAPGGKSISKGSAVSGENEILFEPGSCFRIDEVHPRTDEPSQDEANITCDEGQRYNFEMTLVR